MPMKNQKAYSLVELVVAMALASILVLASGMLLLGNNRAFNLVYASVHEPIQQDSQVITTAFGAMARKADRNEYHVYRIVNDTFIDAVPLPGESIAAGQAVEFRYWDQPFYELSGGMDTMDITDTGTNYVLFYLQDKQLYVDYGRVMNHVGAIQNGKRRTDGVLTNSLTDYVDTSASTEIFSHEIVGGVGNACVSLDMTLVNDEGQTAEINTAALLRVGWPK